MKSKETLQIKILPLIFGIETTQLKDEEIKLFTTYPVAGFILFNRNMLSRETYNDCSEKEFANIAIQRLSELTQSIKSLYKNHGYKPFILIDQEGGKVQRIKPPIGDKSYPNSQELGQAFEQDPIKGEVLIRENYKEIMQELKKFNIDSPVAPVADLLHPGAHTVIGNRSFGEGATLVINGAKFAIEAILQQEGIAVMKHIPGHGRSKTDSHYDLPIVDNQLQELEESDFVIFRELSKIFNGNNQLWAMTAHIIYTALDSEAPITLSKKAINYIREQIGFKGILISDALEMKALAKSVFGEDNIAPEQMTKLANMSHDAGCNLVLHCNHNRKEMEAICEHFTDQQRFCDEQVLDALESIKCY
jgi:beta-glucosidase